MEDCVEEGGPSCPTNMVSTEQLLHSFTRYHFRIDVRTIEEWDEGKSPRLFMVYLYLFSYFIDE